MLQSVNSTNLYAQFEALRNNNRKNIGLGANSGNNINSNIARSKLSRNNPSRAYETGTKSSDLDAANTTLKADTAVSGTFTTSNCDPLSFGQRRDAGFHQFELDMDNYFFKIHSGAAKLDPDELQAHIDRGFEIYKQAAIEAGLTDGNCKEYDAYIMERVLWAVQAGNASGAVGAQRLRGEEMIGRSKMEISESGMSIKNFQFFHAEYWFKERDMFELILNAGKEFAQDRKLPDPTLSENLHNYGFFTWDSLGMLSNEFDLPEGFVPPSRDFYILFETDKFHMEIAGKIVSMTEVWNMTSLNELNDYLAEKRINLGLLQMAAKALNGTNKMFLDDELQKLFDLSIAKTTPHANFIETPLTSAYEAFTGLNQKSSNYLA